MSRSNYDKPFYVDVGTSIAAVRCASNHDVVVRYDHVRMGKCAIEEAERICDRLNAEVRASIGNAAAMRDALLEARRFVWTSAQRSDRDLLVTGDEKRGPYVLTPKETLVKIDAAISASARQCDVGTAEEQKFRHSEYCKKSSMGKGCTQCPLKDTLDCRFAWMQMPYKEAKHGEL